MESLYYITRKNVLQVIEPINYKDNNYKDCILEGIFDKNYRDCILEGIFDKNYRDCILEGIFDNNYKDCILEGIFWQQLQGLYFRRDFGKISQF